MPVLPPRASRYVAQKKREGELPERLWRTALDLLIPAGVGWLPSVVFVGGISQGSCHGLRAAHSQVFKVICHPCANTVLLGIALYLTCSQTIRNYHSSPAEKKVNGNLVRI